ncbi:MAG: protein translocase subunit SecD [Candidatus Moranbacteria bacterium]|nr:protein translocase subunit SecD [Candidatus Moranbacteria bacterium]
MKREHKIRWQFGAVLLLALVSGLISYPQALSFWPGGFNLLNQLQVNRGLDLQGGIHLEYAADLSNIEPAKQTEALQAAEAVIERRVNAFGVGEPLVQLATAGDEKRIIVELPGIKNIEEAKNLIKETPFLEFREQAGDEVKKQVEEYNANAKKEAEDILARVKAGDDFATLAKAMSEDPGSKDQGGELDFVKKGTFVPEFDEVVFSDDLKPGQIKDSLIETDYGYHVIKKLEVRGEGDDKEVKSAHILRLKQSLQSDPLLAYQPTGLSGKNLKSASVTYQQQGLGSPQIQLQFDAEGTALFAEITKRNIGKPVAIFLDNELLQAPTIQTEIPNGQAVITGNYTVAEATAQVKRLNEGALPVPIELVGQQSVDASLGQVALDQSLKAGFVGLLAVAVFMVLFYRFLGVIAVFALLLYSAMLLALFKLSVLTPFPITVTLSGIAGFILSIGIAVDANVLIFERTREELSFGKGAIKSIKEGFRRAWPSIRDGHVSTLLTTFILVGLGTGFVKGFAIILALGVLLSLFTAVVLVRITTTFFIGEWMERHPWILVSPKKRIE